MKKFLVILALCIAAMSAPLSALAAPGDIAGQYYSTDINTILNGAEIDSINIGGQTLISAEDMQYYSFGVYWEQEARALQIYTVPNAVNGAPPVIKKSNYPSGNILGNYYETDIITCLDGQEITAYNIGGRTYIWAEQMRDFGYVVTWEEGERRLEITSPDRAGYIYSIPLTFGGETAEEGTGAFSILYTKDKIVGSGDSRYFNARFSLNRNQYAIDLEFYQNEGLFHSTALLDKLHSFKSSGYGVETEINPREKYDIINQSVKITVNGHTAENIEVIGGAGNGHVDFYLRFSGIPLLKQEEIESIYFSLDEEENAGKYEIEYPEYYDTSTNDILRKLKKNENDFIQTTYSTADYIAVGFCESPSLGVVLQHFYLVKKSYLSISSDIFYKVRKFDGFNYDDLKPFAFKIGDVKNNLLFSCKSEQKTGDFYVEMDSGAVHLLAQHEN